MSTEDIERLDRQRADLRDRIAKLEDAVDLIAGFLVLDEARIFMPLLETIENIVVPSERIPF